MIRNSYAVFAVLKIMIAIMAFIGIIVHIYAIAKARNTIIDKVVIYYNMVDLLPLILSSLIGAAVFFIGNIFQNRKLDKLMKCC